MKKGELNVQVGRMMVGMSQMKLEGGGFLKDLGRKDGKVRTDNLAPCMKVVQIPTMKYVESEG